MRLSRRTAAAIAAAATVLTLSPGLVAPASAATGTISGTVSAPGGVDDVTVTLYENVDGDWSYVDDDFYEGDDVASAPYSFSVEPGTYVVRAVGGKDGIPYAPEYWNNAATRDNATRIVSNGDSKTANVDLVAASYITGRLTVPAGTDPLEASVEVYDEAGDYTGEGTVEPDGSWSTGALSAGNYTIAFNRYTDSPFKVEYYKNVPEASGFSAATVVNVGASTTKPDIDETLALGGVITGTVLDDQGRPVRNADVYAYDRDGALDGHSTETDGDGAFTIRGLSDASYLVNVYDYSTATTYYLPNNARTEAAARPIQISSARTVALGTVLVGDVKTVTATARPRVDGATSVGSLVTAFPGTWSVAGVGYTYSWLRNGVPTGVTTSTYRVGAADAGQRLSVQVGASRLGSIPGSATSDQVGIGKVGSSTALKAKGKKKRKATLTVTVSTPGVTPSGTVTIKDGRKVVRTVAVPASGRVVVTLKKQKVGKHTYSATYSGSGTANGSAATSKTKVRR